MEHVEMLRDYGGRERVLSLLPGQQAHWWMPPYSHLSGLETFIFVFRSSAWRMETLTFILQGLNKGWWMASNGLKNAYLHVLIHPSHWQYLRFAIWNLTGKLIGYQWKFFPFGSSTTPRVFSLNVLAPVVAHLHLQECLMYHYSNGIFNALASTNQVDHTHDLGLCCHFRLRFVLHLQKLAPCPISGDGASWGRGQHS